VALPGGKAEKPPRRYEITRSMKAFTKGDSKFELGVCEAGKRGKPIERVCGR
jgi:hypothetical protein